MGTAVSGWAATLTRPVDLFTSPARPYKHSSLQPPIPTPQGQWGVNVTPAVTFLYFLGVQEALSWNSSLMLWFFAPNFLKPPPGDGGTCPRGPSLAGQAVAPSKATYPEASCSCSSPGLCIHFTLCCLNLSFRSQNIFKNSFIF